MIELKTGSVRLYAPKISFPQAFVAGQSFIVDVEVPQNMDLANSNAYLAVWVSNAGKIPNTGSNLLDVVSANKDFSGQTIQVKFNDLRLPPRDCIIGLCQSVNYESKLSVVKPENVTTTVTIPHGKERVQFSESVALDVSIDEGDVTLNYAAVVAPSDDTFVAVWDVTNNENFDTFDPIVKVKVDDTHQSGSVDLGNNFTIGSYVAGYLVNGYARVPSKYSALAGYLKFEVT